MIVAMLLLHYKDQHDTTVSLALVQCECHSGK